MKSRLVSQDDSGGRHYTTWTGSIRSLRKKIPHFTQEDFKIGKDINKYMDCIVFVSHGSPQSILFLPPVFSTRKRHHAESEQIYLCDSSQRVAQNRPLSRVIRPRC